MAPRVGSHEYETLDAVDLHINHRRWVGWDDAPRVGSHEYETLDAVDLHINHRRWVGWDDGTACW